MNRAYEMSSGGFEQRLLNELRTFVECRADAHAADQGHESTAAPGPRGRSRWSRLTVSPRRWTAVAATAAAIGALIAVTRSFTGSGAGLAQAFPVLNTPTISVPGLLSLLHDGGATLPDARLDVRHARVITTPWGAGYLLTDQHTRWMCLAIPGIDGSWGAGCGTARSAERHGVGGVALSIDKAKATEYVALLPQGATATAQLQNGTIKPLPLRDGVLAIVIHHPTVITTNIAGHTTTATLTPPQASVPPSIGASATAPPSASPSIGGGAGAH